MDDPDFRSRLLTLAVHDLRNAVNSVQLSAHLLRSDALPPDLEPDLAMLEASVLATRHMIETLGAYTRSLRDPHQLHPEPCSPTDLLHDAAAAAQTARSKPVQITIDPPVPLPPIRIDRDLATRALTLALANALDASRLGQVHLSCRLDDSPHRCHIEILTPEPPTPSLHSAPITPDHVEHLTASPHERRSLDLALVAHLCHRLHGTAHLEVVPGQLSRILLDWPT
jgi:signal transduction histidine kinase